MNPCSHKRLKKCCKPFWSNDLQIMWDSLRKAENIYLSSQGRGRVSNLEQFRHAQKNFDRAYRRAERKYFYNKQCEIETICTENPKLFWQTLKQLGPHKSKSIPFEIIKENGNSETQVNVVLNHWKEEFERLFNFGNQDTHEEFVHANVNTLPGLNDPISMCEVDKAVNRAKTNKAVGVDNLPNEILKNKETVKLLTCLFNKIFSLQKVPSMWSVGIIKPIPKSSLTDPRVPLQYRGITLLSTVYKLFSSVLNNRIVKVCNTHDLIVDEQNGFRAGRACIDHLFVLSSIIRNRKNRNLPTYTCFIDFEKAFDRIDRNYLFSKLQNKGFQGNMLNCIKAIYAECKCTVNVNGLLTDEFSSAYGVRQGDNLSPTLFNLYINDLVDEIKAGSKGIKCNDTAVHCLLYADDLVLISEDERDLQVMINILQKWCLKWKMKINSDKSKVVHFRSTNKEETQYTFKLGNDVIDIVDKYKYLGIVLHYSLNFEMSSSILAKSGGRALGSICTKFRSIKGLGFKTFTKLFHSGVAPILDYCSGVWGNGNHNKIDTVQNRALRFFLGVHRFAPNLAVQGDCGWLSSISRRKLEMIRLWNRLVRMDRNRLTFKVFKWDHMLCSRNWSKDIKEILSLCNMSNSFGSFTPISTEFVKNVLSQKNVTLWKENIKDVSKLRTYRIFKEDFKTESYLFKVSNRQHRSILSQFRCGILPLKVETGRFIGIPPELRLCLFCTEDIIEDETHFLLHCCKYREIRESYFINRIIPYVYDFENLNDNEKINVLLSDVFVKQTAELLWNCFDIRRKNMYNN